jgi:HEAT repeat protein
VAVRAVARFQAVRPDIGARLDVIAQRDPEIAVRAAAEEARLAHDPTRVRPRQDLDELLRRVESPDARQREAAIDALGAMGVDADPARQARIELALTDHLSHDAAYPVRESAALAMWKIGRASPRVIDALARALGDEHLLVQAMAAQVLGNFGPQAATAVPALKALAATAPAPEVAATAKDAILRIGP